MSTLRKVCMLLAVATTVASLGFPNAAFAKQPLSPEDIYLFDAPQSVVLAPENQGAACIRCSIDTDSREERFSLWTVTGEGQEPRPLEPREPDARNPVYSPDGRWIAIRSTRLRPDGWKQTPTVPLESEPATDIWLVAADGSRVLPLAGADKPYGRVFNDSFYGRVSFSPDGRFLAFVADDGRDPRSAEEIDADVLVVRPDQGEGYTGYGTAQVWLAELDFDSGTHAARAIRRLTNDTFWYGDPQWLPDGSALVCHVNKTADVESIRYSINKNYDLWSIDAASGRQRRLTFGPGPEVSPRVSPDGSRLVCLSSPRKGPHADVFNLVLVTLAEPRQQRVLFDHHGADAQDPPHPIPAFPLPDECWGGAEAVVYTTSKGTSSETIRLELETGQARPFDPNGEHASHLEARHARRQQLTPRGNAFLQERLIAEERVVDWTNDGLRLEGVITLPPPEVTAAPYPLVVYPHGGPHSRASRGFNMTVQVLAANGYLVFQPNFRGSAGYGRAFLDADRNDLGGGDMRDILTGIESLAEQELIDPQRQFVYGVSYGGFMTSWLVGHTTQFRAAVAQNAVTDMNVMWGLSDLQSWTEWELMGRPWEVPAAMRKHSPIESAGAIVTPTLVLHSREDRRCPLAMGRMFHQSLVARSVPTGMVVYPHEGHGIRQPRHQVDVLRRVLDWFRRHDPGAEIRIVTLGDSITKGVRAGVQAEETFAAMIESGLRERGLQAVVTNVGIGGERTDQALKRLERDVIALRPHVVTIMYGTNDSYVDQGQEASRLSVDEYRVNLVELVTRLRSAGIVPVLMTEPRWGAQAKPNGAGEHPNLRLEQYVEACREVARETDAPLVDHFSHWSEAEAQGTDLGEWTTDHCHPNPAGHRALAEQILPAVLPR